MRVERLPSKIMRNWLLPEFIEDILPVEAGRIEHLRGKLLGVFRSYGYELVIPPMLEYLESLLTGTGHDLDLRTFKLVDQLSGRMMGFRADITPQVARIDAHLINTSNLTRLCYCGTVLHTRPRGMTATREPIQAGAEIYGHPGIESDVEIQAMMYDALMACGVRASRLDIGHVGVFRALCRLGDIGPGVESDLQDALESKDVTRIRDVTTELNPVVRDAMRLLPELYGDNSVLVRARSVLPSDPAISSALDDLSTLARASKFSVGIDLADLRGYHYHSGAVFAAYVPGSSSAIALGGRYDDVGKAFGRARPATGFSMDLRELVQVVPAMEDISAIRAPFSDDSGLATEIQRLRSSGEVVVTDLPGSGGPGIRCDRELVRDGRKWAVRSVLK